MDRPHAEANANSQPFLRKFPRVTATRAAQIRRSPSRHALDFDGRDCTDSDNHEHSLCTDITVPKFRSRSAGLASAQPSPSAIPQRSGAVNLLR